MIQPQAMLWSGETLSELLKALMTAVAGERVGRPAHPLAIGPGGPSSADRCGRRARSQAWGRPAGIPGGRRADSDWGPAVRSGWDRVAGRAVEGDGVSSVGNC